MSATLVTPKTTSGGEIVRELVNASDGAGLHLEDGGRITLGDVAAAKFGTSDFSVEFVLNQTGENAIDNYIYFTNAGGNNRVYFRNDLSDNLLRITFRDSGGTASDKDINYDMSADYGTPTHYVLTFDRDGDATLYKNGNSVGSVDISSASSINLGDGNTNEQAISSVASYGVLGTFYRFRTWNKLVDAKALYERADVDFADQYGSQTNKISGAVDKNWGTNQADTGNDTNDRATFNANYVWSIQGAPTDISVASNVLQFTTASSNQGIYYPSILTGGKKYRVTIRTGTITGDSFKVQQFDGSSLNDIGTLVASTTNVFEFTADSTTNGNLLIYGTGSGTLQINAASVDNEVVAIGAVSDYDLAFANPTQSLTVQDRSGSADGTCSASGVTQVQPVVQLNATAARIGTTAATVADGDLQVSGNIGVNIAPDGSDWNANSKIVHAYQNDGHGAMFKAESNSTSLVVSAASKGYIATLEEKDLAFWTNGSERLTIDSSGNVGIGESSPAKTLHVRGSSRLEATTNPTMQFKRAGNAAGNGSIQCLGSDDSVDYAITFAGTTAGAMQFSTATADALTIDSTGTATISKPQQTTTGTPFSGAALKLLPSGITSVTGLTSLALSTSNTDNYGFLISGHRAESSGGQPTFRISSHNGSDTGAVAMTIDNANLAKFYGGIAFGSQTNTSATGATATGTILDHYEEGTFTPTFYGGTTAGTYTIGTAVGKYTRIGNVVTINVSLINISESSAGSGAIRVGGLPFQTANTQTQGHIGATRFRSFTSSGNTPNVSIAGATSAVAFVQYVSGADDSLVQVSGLSSGNSDISFSLTYFV